MSDEFTVKERRMLDSWTAIDPPPDFADRVIAMHPGRRLLPLAIGVATCAIAAAAIVLVVLRPEAVVEKAQPIAIATPDAAAPGIEPRSLDAGITDAPLMTIQDAAPFANDPYDLDLEVGETATIHDPRGEARINFYSPLCKAGMQIELAKNTRFEPRTANQGVFGVVMSVGNGPWSYRASCMSGGLPEAPFATGRVVVIRDAATRPLPKPPGVMRVDADGRTWRVSYQSTVPPIDVVPPPGAERMHLSQKGVPDRSFPLYRTRVPLVLTEGRYEIFFTHGGLTTGKKTTLVIELDPTAPQIMIEAPSETEAATSTLNVRGMALPGWGVRFEGANIPTDPQLRFQARVQLRPGFKTLALRFDHAQRGVHYYLRRLR